MWWHKRQALEVRLEISPWIKWIIDYILTHLNQNPFYCVSNTQSSCCNSSTFAVQTVQSKAGTDRPKRNPVPCDTWRSHHSIPRPCHQGQRHNPGGDFYLQDPRLHQVWLRQPVHDHRRQEFGTCRHCRQQREASRILWHCSHQGRKRPHVCH